MNTSKKFGFTLAEGTPCIDPLQLVAQRAFTLAEVLITLAVIGVVAAMTIPTLVAKINQKLSENRQEVIEKRLLDGLNRYSTMEDGLSKQYESTYDFLVGLSKYYKMAQICKADEITNCIPYSKIYYGDEGENVEVSSLTGIDSFISNGSENYLAPASFITAQGTPVVIAFKKGCVWDSERAMRDIADSGCIAYMYDENGTRNPNKIGNDWIGRGLTIVPPSKEAAAIATINGIKIMEKAFFITSGLTKAQCNEEISKNYGITQCSYEDDRWAAAMKYCHDKGWHLCKADASECDKIAKGLYKNTATGKNDLNSYNWANSEYKIDLELASNKLGLKVWDGSDLTENNVETYFWADTEENKRKSYSFGLNISNIDFLLPLDRNDDSTFVLCVGD